MKIFFTSDIHGNQIILSKIKLGIIPQYKPDRIIITGDICPKASNVNLFELQKIQQEFITTQLYPFIDSIWKEHQIYTNHIFGNDDWIKDDEYSFYHLNNSQFIKDNLYIKYFEYCHITPFTTNREVNNNKLRFELHQLNIQPDDIIVSHDVPFDTRDKIINGEHVGAIPLKELINSREPRAIIGGHIHEDFGDWFDKNTNTYVFNCACDHLTNTLRGFILDIQDKKIVDVIKVREM